MAERLCWFTTKFNMRAGRSGWIQEGHSTLQYETNKLLHIGLTMGGTVHTSIKTLGADKADELPASLNELPVFINFNSGDVDEPDAVEMTLPVAVDDSYIPEFPKQEYDRLSGIAVAALLRKYPGTAMFQKPSD